MNVMFGQTNLNSIRLLNAAGYDVVTPSQQECCGALYAHSGNMDRARECARANITAFAQHDCDAIIINAAGCGSSLKEYGNWLDNDAQAKQFGAKVKDLTEWLVSSGFCRVGPIDPFEWQGHLPRRLSSRPRPAHHPPAARSGQSYRRGKFC